MDIFYVSFPAFLSYFSCFTYCHRMHNQKQSTGTQGEWLAVQYLQAQGYHLLERNWRVGHKEIDIICRQEDIIIFVEVKARRSVRYGHPEEAVSAQKASLIVEAAMAYLEDKVYKDIRFDIVSVTLLNGKEPELFHIKDAFY